MVTLKHVVQTTTFAFIATLALVFLPGCAKQKKTNLPRLRPLTSYIDYQETQNDITLRAKKLSQTDCTELFGNRAKLLFKKKRRRQPVYPIQLSISNQSESPIVLKPENISLELTPYTDVASRLKHNAVLQVIGGIACALITTGFLVGGALFGAVSFGMFTALFGSIGATVTSPLLVAGLSALVITPFFVVIGTPVVSTMRGMKSAQKNLIIKQELKHKSFQTGLRINKGQTIDTLIFVTRSKYKTDFTIALTEQRSSKEVATYDVQLQQEYHSL